MSDAARRVRLLLADVILVGSSKTFAHHRVARVIVREERETVADVCRVVDALCLASGCPLLIRYTRNVSHSPRPRYNWNEAVEQTRYGTYAR